MKLNKRSENPLLNHVFRLYLLRCGVLTISTAALAYVTSWAILHFLEAHFENWWLYYRSAYVYIAAILIWGVGLVVLTYQLLAQVVSYVDELKAATTQMFDKQIDTIELSPELGDIANKINILRQEAEKNEHLARENEQKKNDLIMYLAHDLKTPLSSTIGYLNFLLDEQEIPPSMQQKYLKIALQKAQRLDELISEFFEITRYNLSTITLQCSETNLTMLLEQLIFEFKPLLLEKNLRCSLAVPDDLRLTCDANKIQRVFDNLLRNAIIYSFSDSCIEIVGVQKNDAMIITFRNHGYTIAPEKLSKIFDQFFRMDDSRSSSGGSGLGLAIARQIVELHSGHITAYSSNNLIEFIVTLPVS